MRIKRTPIADHRHTLSVENLGPLGLADLRFASLTVLVGPQAAGKSIFLQMLKLLVDAPHIKYEFRRANIDWENNFKLFLDVYFGEGMRGLWNSSSTQVTFQGRPVNLPKLLRIVRPRKGEAMFYIPAQRVLAMRDGWPQAFGYYDAGIPFTVREFSEQLRQLMTSFGTAGTLFPVPRRLKTEFRQLIQQHLFPGFDLKVDTERAQKRMVLSSAKDASVLPFMVWSAGQREFVPLLLGLYWLLNPAGAARRKGLKWVVIEELEMGLHPRAISVVLLMLFELVSRGYRVCISTHSPQVLDAVWALRHLKENHADASVLLKVFGAPASVPLLKMVKKVMRKSTRVYYFDRDGKAARDISKLDPASEQAGESGWGGLSEFSGRANDAVAHAVANSKSEVNR